MNDFYRELAGLLWDWGCILAFVLTLHPWWRPLPPKEKKP